MIQNIKLYLLENNTGQIPGVKENPRDLTGDGFAKAKQSIKDFPEMLEVRTLVVVKHGEMFVVIGGNQRLRAMRDLDYDTAPVMVVDWTVDKINEFIIKDNIEYGVWNFDLLANEWDSVPLVEWGLELPYSLEQDILDEDPKDLSEKVMYAFKLEIDCKTEQNLQNIYDEMKERGLVCRILTL